MLLDDLLGERRTIPLTLPSRATQMSVLAQCDHQPEYQRQAGLDVMNWGGTRPIRKKLRGQTPRARAYATALNVVAA